MAFDQSTRNRLQKFVSNARAILGEEFTRQLQATYGLDPKQGTVAAIDSLTHLDNRQRQTAHLLRETLAHYLATTPGKGEKDRTKQVLDRIVREQAFTVLNRLAALRMAEARGFLLESIARAHSSKGFQLYRQLSGTAHGETGDAYRNYLFSLFDEFSLDLAVLFDRHSAQGRLFPRESALLELLAEINHHEIEHLWSEDETIGWIYQYFNSQEERKKMRAESQAPRNSRELAVRNQFFTPRYVVEFLTDNTLGRIWYEMTQGKTTLVESCRYLVRRPTEIYLKLGETAPEAETSEGEALSQEELLKQPVYIPHRPLKDPRSIRMLDPACGSMHFGLYAFDLFERIYLEAWQLEQQLGPDAFTREAGQRALQSTFDSLEAFTQQIPKLIIEHNIHGVDIDPRAVQIAGLSLWQRAQRAWHQQGIKPQQRPTIVKSNIVCAEPMPGEKVLLQEFTSKLNPPVLGQLLEVIFDKMQLAGEAGTLLKIEEEIQTAIHEAREQWLKQSGSNSVGDMFQAELDAATAQAKLGFDLRGIDDETFWDDAEQRILQALSDYADQAESNADQKRLFAEDAAKGFAFIDLCRKRFDVVLMNPPFGDPSKNIKNYLSSVYSGQPNDLYSCFIERAIDGLCIGRSGYVTPREFITYSSFKNLRKKVIFSLSNIEIFADFGLGVMDDAMVRAAVYVLESRKIKSDKKSPYLRFIGEENKAETLLNSCQMINAGDASDRRAYFANQNDFAHVGEGALAYWIPSRTIKRFSGSLFSELAGDARLGVQTANNFQFLRLSSEVSSDMNRDGDWRAYLKGGEFQKYYNNIHMQIYWKSDGEHIANSYGASVRLRDIDQYERIGLNYPLINESGINVGILPYRAVFDNGSPSIYPNDPNQVFLILGLLNSRFAELCFRCLTSTRHWQVGYLRNIPWVEVNAEKSEKIASIAEAAADIQLSIISEDELSVDYSLAELFKSVNDFGLKEGVHKYLKQQLNKEVDLIEKDYELDVLACEAFMVSPEEKETLLNVVGIHPCEIEKYAESVNDYREHKVSNFQIEKLSWDLRITPRQVLAQDKVNLQNLATEKLSKILSYIFGLLLGRWYSLPLVNNGLGKYLDEKKISNTSASNISVIPLDRTNSSYFIESLSNTLTGISNLKDVNIEDICSGMDVKLVDYFSKPSGFFHYHLGIYTRSQRQAPIYWPLQTPSGSYTLWVYYHSLNEQTLYTCVNDYVEPKIAQVEQDLNGLRSKSARSSQEEKELEKLSDLASELRDFRDELLRLAKFWKPNLNDGVQITAAPLWKLFQHKAWQKKLKETWESLEKGDYDWAHLACSIWPERVLRKCHQDRSLAIAHDVEDHFWHEVEVPVKRGKKLTGETKLEWQPKDLTEAELTALVKKLAEEKK